MNLFFGFLLSYFILLVRFDLFFNLGFNISIYMEVWARSNSYLNLFYSFMLAQYKLKKEMMSFLTSVINWLMGVPVGLKLNKPLTEFLGRFFLYHIYLWDSNIGLLYSHFMQLISNCLVFFQGSIVIFKESLPYLLNFIAFSGFLGISLFISLCKDTLSLFVIHTYCFYVYALRWVFKDSIIIVKFSIIT